MGICSFHGHGWKVVSEQLVIITEGNETWTYCCLTKKCREEAQTKRNAVNFRGVASGNLCNFLTTESVPCAKKSVTPGAGRCSDHRFSTCKLCGKVATHECGVTKDGGGLCAHKLCDEHTACLSCLGTTVIKTRPTISIR
jgi:hypothetical protein